MSKMMRRAVLNEEYLDYDQRSIILKHVVVLGLCVVVIPLALIFVSLDIDGYWCFCFTGIVAGSCVIPITLAIAWHRITGKYLEKKEPFNFNI